MLSLTPAAGFRAVMDAERLGFREGSFVVAMFVLFHLPDPLAGLRESDSANRAAVEAGSRAGIELRESPGVPLTPEVTAGADLVVTFGCSVDDVVGDVLVEDWALVDDDGQPLRDYDQIRDGIRSRVEILAERLSDGPAAFLGRGPSPDKYRSALSDDLRKRGLAHR